MGKLTIEGRASKEYAYDRMEISVTFWATEGATATALKRVTEQSEEFLGILDKAGIPPETVRIGEDSTEKRTYDSRFQVEAERELTLCVPFNMDTLNFVRDTVQKNALDAKIDTHYKFSNPDALHAELIRLALEDSKEKANSIAETMGQKVVGIKTMSVGNVEGKNVIQETERLYTGLCLEAAMAPLSSRVQAPVSIENESVEVVWLIE